MSIVSSGLSIRLHLLYLISWDVTYIDVGMSLYAVRYKL